MAIMEVNAVDTTTRTVSDGIMTLDCDYLIVATGATHAYFGHPNYAQFAPGLKTIDDARDLRDRLLFACELAERTDSEELRQRCPTTVIGRRSDRRRDGRRSFRTMSPNTEGGVQEN